MSHKRYFKTLQKRLNGRFKRRIVHQVRDRKHIPGFLKDVAERGVRMIRLQYDLRPRGVRFFYFMPPVAQSITLDLATLNALITPAPSNVMSLQSLQ